MKKLTYSLLLLMLLTSVPALADYAPVNVQTALKKMYPAAKDVAWSRDETYYVADFIQNGFDTKVWFNSKAQWEMRQIDWETMDEVPNAVYNAFAASEYSDGMVQGSHLSSVSQTGSGGFCNCGNGKYTDQVPTTVHPRRWTGG